MPVRISKNLILLFILSIITIGITSYFSYRNIIITSEYSAIVSQKREILLQIERVQNQNFFTQESALKAIQTGDAKYVNDYDSNRQILTREVASLMYFEKDNNTQQQNTQNLKLYVTQSLTSIDSVLEVNLGPSDAALLYLETGKPKANSSEIKTLLNTINEQENNLLLLSEAENKKASYKGIYFTFLSAGLSLLFVLWFLILLNKDITRRKKAEKFALENEKKYRNIIAQAGDLIFTCDYKGFFKTLSPGVINITGFSPEELSGKHFNFIVEPGELEEITWYYRSQFDNKTDETLKEFQIVTKTGEKKWVEQKVMLLKEGDRVSGFQCTMRDISRSKNIQSALDESNKKFLAVFNSAIQAVCISELTNLSRPGVITEVNNAFCELFKLRKSEITGHTLPELGQISGTELEKIITDISSKKFISAPELNITTKLGEKIACQVSFNDMELGGALYRIWVFNSIAERKKMENELVSAKDQAQESIRVKESFVANMSHEIRTPITGIMGLTELLEQTPLSKEQKEYLGGIMHSSESLLTIINEILDISKINAGKIIVEKVPFNLHTVIRNVVFTLEPKANQKGILFKCNIDSSVPENAIGDSVRLSQILWNLAGNAIKFTEKGFVEINVIKLSEEKNKIRLLFTVIDTGIGIAKNRIKNIFEEFTQADSSISRKYGGTGLGLPIANKLVELHGGTISIESQEGIGSAFRFSLEYGKYSPQFMSPDDEIEKLKLKNEVDLTGLTVLVAEDNIINQGVCSKILTNKGAKVDIADNGKKVIELMKSKSYDIILMDVQMPEMNGYEATKYIRSNMRPPKSTLPIIALTAFALEGENEKCFNAGMNGYISKPFKANDLCNKVWQYTRQKKSFATY